MRTRVRDEVVDLTQGIGTVVSVMNSSASQIYSWGHYLPPGSSQFTHTSSALPGRVGVYSNITDNNTGPGTYNPCDHIKITWECPLHTVTSSGSLDASGMLSCNCVITMGAAMAADWASQSFPSMASTETLVAEATTSMDPSRIRGGNFNLPQFLGELREMRDTLGRACFSTDSFLQRVTAIAKEFGMVTGRDIRENRLRDLLRIGVKTDLSLKFAYKPLIGDLVSLYKSVSNILALLRKLENTKPFRVYGTSSRSTSQSSDFSGYPYSYHSWGNTRNYRRTVTTWARVRYTDPIAALPTDSVERLYDIHRRVAAVLDSFRVGSIVRTGWELTSLTFIIDWFIDIGSWLDRFDNFSLEMSYQTLTTGYSVTEVADCLGYVRPHTGEFELRLQDTKAASMVVGRVVRKRYRRVVAPLPFSSPAFPPPKVRFPSFGKLVTLLELLLTWSKVV